MQKKMMNKKVLNNNLYSTFVINKYYLNKILKDKNNNINYCFLNNNLLFHFINKIKSNKLISNIYKKKEIRLNFIKSFNFILNKKNKLTISKINNINNKLYNIVYLRKSKNKEDNQLKKNRIKFNKLLFFKKNKLKKYNLFLNKFKNKLYFLIKNKKNLINVNKKIKILIYKLIINLLHLKKKKNNINNAKIFLNSLYFKSKRQSNLSNIFYKKSQKNNYKKVDYSFVKFYKSKFSNLVNEKFFNIVKNFKKKQVLSFILFFFNFISLDYYTKNKKLISKNNLFFNIKKVKKIKRRVINNFFYKKKLYLKRINKKYYSLLTKYKRDINKYIKNKKKINYLFYKKNNLQLYNFLKTKKLNKKNNNLHINLNKKKYNLNFFLNYLNFKKNNTFKKFNSNNLILNNKIIISNFLYKKLLILNYILKNISKHNPSNLKKIYIYANNFLVNYNKKKYNAFSKKHTDKKIINMFFYDTSINNLIDVYKQDFINLNNNDILFDLDSYNVKLNSILVQDIKENNKLYNITCKYLDLIKYFNYYNNYNGEILKHIKIFRKNIKNKYKKKYISSKKRINFNKKMYNILYYKYKKYLYINNNFSKIKYNYQVKSKLEYNINYFYNNLYNTVNVFRPLHIYYNITTKNTRYIILNNKFKILKSKSLGLLNIDRREMRQKKSKIKLSEFFLKNLKTIFQKNKYKNLFNELHFHLVRHKYFTYLVFKLFKKYIRKKIKKIEKKKKKYFALTFINMIYSLKYRKRKYKKNKNIYSGRYFFNKFFIKKYKSIKNYKFINKYKN